MAALCLGISSAKYQTHCLHASHTTVGDNSVFSHYVTRINFSLVSSYILLISSELSLEKHLPCPYFYQESVYGNLGIHSRGWKEESVLCLLRLLAVAGIPRQVATSLLFPSAPSHCILLCACVTSPSASLLHEGLWKHSELTWIIQDNLLHWRPLI